MLHVVCVHTKVLAKKYRTLWRATDSEGLFDTLGATETSLWIGGLGL